MNINLYAMEAVRNQRSLQRVVTNTIVLSPINKEAMKNIILERHRLAGTHIVYKNEENNIEGNHFNRLMNRMYAESEGNIGLSLQIWLRNIREYSDNKVYVEDVSALQSLKIKDEHWKWLLYQFILNHHLTKERIAAMFGEETTRIHEVMQEMLKAKILEKIGLNTYVIYRAVKPNVENWLIEEGVLI
ncbi:MAG: hypothetical protein R3E32_03670 [Chitinophagales bacterium]